MPTQPPSAQPEIRLLRSGRHATALANTATQASESHELAIAHTKALAPARAMAGVVGDRQAVVGPSAAERATRKRAARASASENPTTSRRRSVHQRSLPIPPGPDVDALHHPPAAPAPAGVAIRLTIPRLASSVGEASTAVAPQSRLVVLAFQVSLIVR
jgi:hypothetical protein